MSTDPFAALDAPVTGQNDPFSALDGEQKPNFMQRLAGNVKDFAQRLFPQTAAALSQKPVSGAEQSSLITPIAKDVMSGVGHMMATTPGLKQINEAAQFGEDKLNQAMDNISGAKTDYPLQPINDLMSDKIPGYDQSIVGHVIPAVLNAATNPLSWTGAFSEMPWLKGMTAKLPNKIADISSEFSGVKAPALVKAGTSAGRTELQAASQNAGSTGERLADAVNNLTKDMPEGPIANKAMAQMGPIDKTPVVAYLQTKKIEPLNGSLQTSDIKYNNKIDQAISDIKGKNESQQEISGGLNDLIQDPSYKYGLRVTKTPTNIGDVLNPSTKFIDNEPTGDILNGTSVIKISPNNLNQALKDIKIYPGNNISLVRTSEPYESGEDAGEALFKNPEVIHTFNKNFLDNPPPVNTNQLLDPVWEAKNAHSYALRMTKGIDYNSPDASDLADALKGARSIIRGQLEDAAVNSGNPEYAKAMKAMHDKYDLQEQMQQLIGGTEGVNQQSKATRVMGTIFNPDKANFAKQKLLAAFDKANGSDFSGEAKTLNLANSLGPEGEATLMPTQFTGRSLMGMLAPKHLAIPFSSPAIASRLTIPLASLPPHFAAFAAKSGLPISAASSLNQQFNPDSLPPDLRTMLQLQGHP